MEHLYGWYFTYNHFTQKWAACLVEDIPTLQNNHATDKAIRSSRIETLIEMIIKGQGQWDLIKKKYAI